MAPAPPARTRMPVRTRAPSRPWAHQHVYAHLHVRAPSRPCSYPFMPILGHAFDETSADGFNRSSSNPTHSNSNDWGAWASATTASASTSTTGGSAPACVIGPEGPIMVRPEGRIDGTPEGVLVRVNDGPLQAGLQSSLKARRRAACAAIPSVLNLPPNKRVRQIVYRIWPVLDSHPAHPIRLPTSGYGKLCIEYGR